MTFKYLVRDLLNANHPSTIKTITLDQFNEWEEKYVFDGLCGLRVGQSFCNHFDIVDYILYYMTNSDRAMEHILLRYVRTK